MNRRLVDCRWVDNTDILNKYSASTCTAIFVVHINTLLLVVLILDDVMKIDVCWRFSSLPACYQY